MSPPTTTRWCPTAEQVMMLEEMYRGGMKIPNATQIQQITAQLANYGKIEGKNVFYWFQNHKARDKHRLRRKHHFHKHRHFHHHHHLLHYLASSSPPPPPPTATFAALQHATLYNIAPTSLPIPPDQESRVHVEDAHLSSGMNKQEGNPNHDDASERKVKVETEMRRSEEEQEDRMMTMANNRPLITLQLFPLTATNLKEECK